MTAPAEKITALALAVRDVNVHTPQRRRRLAEGVDDIVPGYLVDHEQRAWNREEFLAVALSPPHLPYPSFRRQWVRLSSALRALDASDGAKQKISTRIAVLVRDPEVVCAKGRKMFNEQRFRAHVGSKFDYAPTFENGQWAFIVREPTTRVEEYEEDGQLKYKAVTYDVGDRIKAFPWEG